MNGDEEMGMKCINNSLVDREKIVWCHFVLFIKWESLDHGDILTSKIQ